MMEFGFTREEESWRNMVRDFFTREITPEVSEELRQKGFSRKLYRRLAEAGFLSAFFPEEYGGRGLGFMKQAIFSAEVVRVDLPLGMLSAIGNSVYVLGGTLLSYGSQEQRVRWLPMIARGELISSQGLTEPDAGSDLASVQCRAIQDGERFILNGTKLYSNAINATHMLTVARTDPTVSKYKGISLFLVDLGSPGVSINAMLSLGGEYRSEVSFQDVVVPEFNMLGDKNKGWHYLVSSTMSMERIQPSPWMKPLTMFDRFLQFVREASFEGKPLWENPGVRYALAEIATEVQIGWLLFYKVAWKLARGMDVSNLEAPIAKLYISELQEKFANVALDILGRYGQLESWGLESKWVPMRGRMAREYRESRDMQIGAGTSEIQRTIIARRGLGLGKA